eukprot:XP_001707407.1 Hypothetical protein GL50803_2619 [Giardia lamblia ATCC 50803]
MAVYRQKNNTTQVKARAAAYAAYGLMEAQPNRLVRFYLCRD